MLHIYLNNTRIIKYLIFTFCILLILHLAITSSIYVFDSDHKFVTRSFKLFNFDEEQNIPSFFNSILFIICAVLFFINGNASPRKTMKTWHLMGFIFIFLSLDEACSFHEILTKIPDYFNFKRTGIFYFFWIVPYGIASLLLLFFLIPFIKQMPKRIRSLFIISAIIYVTGAVVVESISGIEFEKNKKSLLFQIFVTTEESCEMLGLILAIYTSFLNLNINIKSIMIKLPEPVLSLKEK